MEATRRRVPIPLPQVIRDIYNDRKALPVLVAAALAVAAAGLDPPILEPAMPSVQAAIRAEPQLQSLLLITAVWKAAVLLIGGVLADVFRSPRILGAGLLGLAAASLGAILLPDGLGFFVSRLVATLCVGIVVPFAIGAVGIAYSGIKRATALGLAYAAFGGATALAGPLALLNGVHGPFLQAFVACSAVAVFAFFIDRRLFPPMPAAEPGQRPLIVAVALFGFGLVAMVATVINVRFDPIHIAVLIGGGASVAVATLILRRRETTSGIRVDVRPVAAVLAIGIVLGFAQTVPLIKMPQYFTIIQQLPPLAATLAIAPFAIALLLAGPISGWLLARIGPRALVAGGLVSIGVANVMLSAVLTTTTSYYLLIVPFALIGAGFVIATTVRTAIIFASVPSQLPGSAAALNDASLGLGTRIAAVFSAVVLTQATLGAFTASLGDLPAAEIEQQLEPLRVILYALGMPAFPELVELVEPAMRQAYAVAFVSGLQTTLVIPGLVAIGAGIIGFFAIGRRDPIKTVFDHRDERVD